MTMLLSCMGMQGSFHVKTNEGNGILLAHPCSIKYSMIDACKIFPSRNVSFLWVGFVHAYDPFYCHNLFCMVKAWLVECSRFTP